MPRAQDQAGEGDIVSGLLQGHPSNLHHIMTTNVQMSIIRSSAPGPPLHIGASHLPRGKDHVLFRLQKRNVRSVEDMVTQNMPSLLKVWDSRSKQSTFQRGLVCICHLCYIGAGVCVCVCVNLKHSHV